MRIITTFIDIIGSLVAIIVILGLLVSLTSCVEIPSAVDYAIKECEKARTSGLTAIAEYCDDYLVRDDPPPSQSPQNLETTDNGNWGRRAPQWVWDQVGSTCVNDTDGVLASVERESMGNTVKWRLYTMVGNTSIHLIWQGERTGGTLPVENLKPAT